MNRLPRSKLAFVRAIHTVSFGIHLSLDTCILSLGEQLVNKRVSLDTGILSIGEQLVK